METPYRDRVVPTQDPIRYTLNLESFTDDPELRCVDYCMQVIDELSVDRDKPTCEELVIASQIAKLRVIRYLLERMTDYAKET